jgi:hypothetical protein
MFNVLGMQKYPFQNRQQVEYLNPKLISFKIITHVLIWLVKWKVRNKNMGFFNFYNL